MKTSIISFFDRIVYFFLAVLTIFSLYFHTSLTTYSQEKHRNILLYSSTTNPVQYVANGCKSAIGYIIDFALFRKQMSELQNLKLEISNIINQNRASEQSASLFNEALQTHKIEHSTKQGVIVKLMYSSESNTIKETFFETQQNNNIKINSVLINNNCILGRVYKQDDKYSYVLLYTDPQFRLPVYTEKSRIFGIIYGGTNLLFTSFTSSDEDKIVKGEKVIIASSDGTLADDLPFGTISNTDGSYAVQTECLRYYKYAIAL